MAVTATDDAEPTCMASWSLTGSVSRRKNMSRGTTFLHIAIDAPLSAVFPIVSAHRSGDAGHSLASVGDIVQLVCTPDAPAPRLARGGSHVWATGRLEKGRQPGELSLVASEVKLMAEATETVSAAPLPMPGGSTLCRAWLRSSACAAGQACPFRHAFADGDEADQFAKIASRGEAMRACDDFAAASASAHVADSRYPLCGSTLGRLKADKGARHAIFASWLVDVFGVTSLRAGAGVVDVAGGKGLISWELAWAHKVPCTVLDPRHARPGASELRRLRRHCLARAEKSRDDRSLSTDGRGESEDCIAGGEAADPDGLVTYVQGCLHDGVDGRRIEDDRAEMLLDRASLLIGMHSDEATEAIVDAALRRGIDFAVVPCCAFPSRFPDRSLADGSAVVTTAQFIRYLKAKAPDDVIREAWLPFEGRNAVLYMAASQVFESSVTA